MQRVYLLLAYALYLLVCVCSTAASTVTREDASKAVINATEAATRALEKITEVSGELEDAYKSFKEASDNALGNSATFKKNAEDATKGYSVAQSVYSIFEKALNNASTHSTNGNSQAAKGKEIVASATKKFTEAMSIAAAAQTVGQSDGADYTQRKLKADEAKKTAETALKEAENVKPIITDIASIKEKLIAASNEAQIVLFRIKAIAANEETKVSLKATNVAAVVAVGTKGSTDSAVERIEKLLIESPVEIRETITLKLMTSREFQMATTRSIRKAQAAAKKVQELQDRIDASLAALASTQNTTEAEVVASSAEKAEMDAYNERLDAEEALKSATRHSSYVTNVRNEVERIVTSAIEEEKANSKRSTKAPSQENEKKLTAKDPFKETDKTLKPAGGVVPAKGVAGEGAPSADGAFHSAWATYTVTALMALTSMCASV